jgi:hypothetical protein
VSDVQKFVNCCCAGIQDSGRRKKRNNKRHGRKHGRKKKSRRYSRMRKKTKKSCWHIRKGKHKLDERRK